MSVWKSEKGDYELRWRFEPRFTGAPAVPEYVLFFEERVLRGNIEFYKSSYLRAASLSLHTTPTICIETPEMAGASRCIPGLPLATETCVPEYRVTLFCPGYAGTTVYPMGWSNTKPKGGRPLDEWHAPAVLVTRAMKTSLGCHMDTVGIQPAFLKGGRVVADVSIEELRTAYSSNDANEAYAAQVTSLAEAILDKKLDDVPFRVRRLVWEAIVQQRSLDMDAERLAHRRYQLDYRLRERMSAAFEVIGLWARP